MKPLTTTMLDFVSDVPVLAQASPEGGVPIELIIALAVIVLGILVYFVAQALRKEEEKPEPKAEERDESRPSKDVLDDRMEVDEAVEIHEGMSLAEIKKAKAAKVRQKDKSKRETAVEATEKSKKEHADEEDEEETADEEAAEEAVEEEEEAPEEEAGVEAEAADEEDEEEGEEGEEGEAEEEAVAEPEEDFGDVDDGWAELSEAFEVEEEEEEEVAEAAEEEPAEEEPAEEEPAEEEPAEEEPAEEEPAEEEPAEEEPAEEEPQEEEPQEEEPAEEEPASLEKGLEKTRTGFIDKLSSLFSGDQLDEEILEEVEEVLFTADIGPRAAQDILDALEEELSGDEKNDPGAVWAFIRQHVEGMLTAREELLDVDEASPYVILVIGVNGVGKTTTIGKMASKFKREGKSVLMVAGDTFRAAAVEQLQVWGERTEIPVHVGESEADPASVVYAGVERAEEEGVDVVICDTAGRLHTKVNLLDELEKMERVCGKVIEEAPHETILVLDANTGQNAIQQAKLFGERLHISGIVLTKLDGTAKGGVILGICDELEAPIRYIGIGEGVRDLRPFDAGEFVEALFM